VPVDSSVVTPNGKVVEVQVLDNSYRPLDLVVSAGTEVVFVNKGRNEHNILPDDVKNDADLLERLASDPSAAAWGVASADLPPGDSYSHVFLEPGVYPYYCSIHGVPGKGMYGVVIVE
jgi:plastocyanin